jgi:peroxygenase
MIDLMMAMLRDVELPSKTAVWGVLLAAYGAIYYYLAIYRRVPSSQEKSRGKTQSHFQDPSSSASRNSDAKPSSSNTEMDPQESLTALQQHILFWDPDNDGILWPHDVYNGFRDIGFNIPFSLTSLLIPVFFSYPTTLGHSILPDPFFRIFLSSIHKAKHGSDSGIYDLKGNLKIDAFEKMFAEFDTEGQGSLGVKELWSLVKRNRVAADPAGWTFAKMEWGTTWLLLQRNGRVEKEDLTGAYRGELFWTLRTDKEERKKGNGIEEERG